MSEFKGTKGKWKHLKSFDHYIEVDEKVLATIHCNEAGKPKYDARLISKAPELLEKLNESMGVIRRLKLSMLAHPDCTEGSEFDDYTSLAQETEDEIEQLIKESTEL